MKISFEKYLKECEKNETWKQTSLEDLEWILRCTKLYGTSKDIKEANEHIKWKIINNKNAIHPFKAYGMRTI